MWKLEANDSKWYKLFWYWLLDDCIKYIQRIREAFFVVDPGTKTTKEPLLDEITNRKSSNQIKEQTTKVQQLKDVKELK